MQELDYRVWVKSEGKFYILYMYSPTVVMGISYDHQITSAFERKDCEFNRFSGFYENDDAVRGKKIYEGDILKVAEHFSGDHHYKEAYGLVNLDDQPWVSGDHVSESLFDCIMNYSATVVGNFYENPTLLDELSAQLELDLLYPTKESNHVA
jgi:hypothetical protein